MLTKFITMEPTQRETAESVVAGLQGMAGPVTIVLSEPFIEHGEYCESELLSWHVAAAEGITATDVLTKIKDVFARNGWKWNRAAYAKAIRIVEAEIAADRG